MQKGLEACDIAIIGGGPAGCAAAIQLARVGRKVILLEKESKAHEKVCGGFLSWEAAHYLQLLGLDLAALGAERIRHVRLIDRQNVIESPLPFAAWSLSRRRLDEALLQAAANARAEIRYGDKVTAFSPSGTSWDLTMQNQNSMRAKAVLLASGKHDVRGWPRKNGFPRHCPVQDMIGFKMHFRLTPQQRKDLHDHVEVCLFNGGYAGLELVEDEIANLCFVVRRKIYASCGGNWPDLLTWLVESAPHLQARLAQAEPLWPRPLAIYGMPYGYLNTQAKIPCGLYRLGDQMAVIPSFAGDGISIALHSAMLAVEKILKGSGCDAYHAQARLDFKRPVGNASMIACLTSFRVGRTIAFQLFQRLPMLITAGIQRVRLPQVLIQGTDIQNPVEKVT